jgi:hypothetical protein
MMILGNLITVLETLPDKERVLKNGFTNPHSWRGSYYELAFEPAENVTIQSMLDCAREAIGATYEGWKGGVFTMSKYSECHLAEEGSTGYPITMETIYCMVEGIDMVEWWDGIIKQAQS